MGSVPSGVRFVFELWFSCCRSAEAPGGAPSHGGDAQSGDGEAQGDAAQVSMIIIINCGGGNIHLNTRAIDTGLMLGFFSQ